ncbi:MAG: hypothetical protein ACE5G8_11375, partial [Anaerolineae bacterium]
MAVQGGQSFGELALGLLLPARFKVLQQGGQVGGVAGPGVCGNFLPGRVDDEDINNFLPPVFAARPVPGLCGGVVVPATSDAAPEVILALGVVLLGLVSEQLALP